MARWSWMWWYLEVRGYEDLEFQASLDKIRVTLSEKQSINKRTGIWLKW
jgi:hypothetical protein